MFKDYKVCISKLSKRYITALILLSLVFSLCSCSKGDSDFDGVRFAKTRQITVLVDSFTDPETDFTVDTSPVARYIHDSVLDECNIDVKFIDSNMYVIQRGNMADISFSDNYNELNTYYRMNSIINISPYLENYSYALTDLINLLGEENIYSCTDDASEVWYLSEQNYEPNSRVTFIRKDWLDKLGLREPSTREEFYNCLVAFRDNADLLLGEDASKMIPFFIDNEPETSAKPFFDSFLDTSIDDQSFYENGFCRVTQEGYENGLRVLNSWYLEGLLPKDFQTIYPNSKESYEPIEYGYVGSFCSRYDYLYAHGENSHIKAFNENCGVEADYIAVNTFENNNGAYTSWQEDYLNESGEKIFIPSTCNEPLACLVYLNWISNSDNIEALLNIDKDNSSNNPFMSDRYLLTCKGLTNSKNLFDMDKAEKARMTALDVVNVQRGNKCVRYNESVFMYITTEIDIVSLFPNSTGQFVCSAISAESGQFDSLYSSKYDEFLECGTNWIIALRTNEWTKVKVQGVLKPL